MGDLKYLMLTLSLAMFGCSAKTYYETTVTSSSAVRFDESPLRIRWKFSSDDLIKNKIEVACAGAFQGAVKKGLAEFQVEGECVDGCLDVRVMAEVVDSSQKVFSYTVPQYNAEKQMYDQQPRIGSRTDYKRVVEMKFYRSDILVHQVRGVSWGSNDRLEAVILPICMAMGRDFPQSLDGKFYRISER